MNKEAIMGKAAAIDGTFTVQRTLSGEKVWVKGDEREGKVGDFIHLVETGALFAADEDTAKACTIMLGREVRVDEAPDPVVDGPGVLGEAKPLTTEAAADAAQEVSGEKAEGDAAANKAEKPVDANKSEGTAKTKAAPKTATK